MTGRFDFVQNGVIDAAHWLRLVIEATGSFWITVGAARALVRLVSLHLHRQTASFLPVRITFSRYLSLGLEFQLAADILSTAFAPTWDELGKLGATAVIRTALNYFLSRDLREFNEREHEEADE